MSHRASFRVSTFAGQSWREHCKEAMSEIRFKPRAFLLAFMYESLPTYVSCWLCWLIEGKHSCLNRQLWPVTRRFVRVMFMSIFTGFLLPIQHILPLWIILRPPDVSFWDVFVTFSFVWLRAGCIASKYAFFGEKDLDATTGIRSSGFTDSHRALRKLGVNWMLNVAGAQRGTLCEELYLACLRCDTDLRKLSFCFEPAVARRLMLEYSEIWEAVEDDMKEAFSGLDKGNGILRKDEEAPIFNFKLGHSKKLIGDELEASSKPLAKGQVPAMVLAFKLINDNFYVTKHEGLMRMLLPLVFAIPSSFIAPVARAACGVAPFGTEISSKVLFGLLVYSHFWSIWLHGLFLSCAIADGSKRSSVMESLEQLIHDGLPLKPGPSTCEHKVIQVLPSHTDLESVHTAQAPSSDEFAEVDRGEGSLKAKVNLTIPQNIIAYQRLRRVVGGGEFGRSYYMRYQCFTLVFFVGLVLQTGCQSIAAYISQGKIEIDAFATAVCTAGALLLGIAYCMMLGFRCNRLHQQLLLDLTSEQMSLYAWLEEQHQLGRTDHPDVESTMRALEILDRLKEAVEMESSMPESLQLNVMFLPAETGSIVLLGGFIATASYFQVQDILQGNGFEFTV